MKWLLAIITALAMAGCSSSSSAVASELANDGAIASVETHKTIEPKVAKHNLAKNLMDKTDITKISYVYASDLITNRKSLNNVVMKLLRRVGKTPYVFSGSTPYGWDCSGMVRWAYEQLGKELPHSATKQAYVGHRVKTPKVGDIVVFGYKGYSSYYHSAIYIGKGKVVNANRGFGGTYIEPLTDYKNKRIVFVRILDTP
jgi:cell wall-associated NlpC family hydrolase